MSIPSKLCVFCKNFYAEATYSYSEQTSGGGYFACNKGHYEAMSGPNDGMLEFRKAIMFAVKCPDYDESEES